MPGLHESTRGIHLIWVNESPAAKGNIFATNTVTRDNTGYILGANPHRRPARRNDNDQSGRRENSLKQINTGWSWIHQQTTRGILTETYRGG